ncbi:CDP-glycerol glycerophosphotransferase family protein [Isoptericola sp. b515]|uniref:CDP-glycerol glycerophosphotransferase family protein n=1 Tax=Isoptericola sp. b515 TaxID=3064652 RepID=UPI00271371CF|nr:CDP-glycerol glycerophosphotransferase family protein [Isoptericola sp. b515]MDO8147987.1 CDP-glycerol glycerophosphotransferase family protein [Isoptericola sp. b515]
MSPVSAPRATFFDRVRRFAGRILLKAGGLATQAVRHSIVGEPELFDPPVETLPRYPVLAYFAEGPDLTYQIRQWLPVLESVAEHLPVAVVTRNWTTTVALREATTLPVMYTRKLDGLRTIYDQVDVKTIIYVNNGMRNFQSLIYQRALHVHVNHGESDKISMVSNQAKAYDHVVVAGQAAIERHRRALIAFDTDRLVVCGRPQLDLDVAPGLPPAARPRTVMYAPTWSGEDDANNYTSLDLYGVEIVRALLQRDDVRIVYKPHPRVLTTDDKAVAQAHREIRRLLQADPGGGHVQPFDADILGLFDGVDLLVTDISSVGLDFLYLRPEAPIVLTDRRTDPEGLRTEAPIAAAADVVDASTVAEVAATLASNLNDDPHRAARAGMRDHYFGFARGESSRRFLALVEDCAARRDALVVSD